MLDLASLVRVMAREDYVCYSTSGRNGPFIRQTLVKLHAIAHATTESISSVVPPTISAHHPVNLTFVGADFSDYAYISIIGVNETCPGKRVFALSVGSSATNQATSVKVSLPAAGNYRLCYSTHADTWVLQAGGNASVHVVPRAQEQRVTGLTVCSSASSTTCDQGTTVRVPAGLEYTFKLSGLNYSDDMRIAWSTERYVVLLFA
jgi:hypothetical protein